MDMQKLMVYIGYAAALLFVGLGIAVIATDLFPTVYNGNIKIIFGVVMILYGFYRMAMISFKNQKRDTYEDYTEQ